MWFLPSRNLHSNKTDQKTDNLLTDKWDERGMHKMLWEYRGMEATPGVEVGVS
jgi:hypothetical protein